MSRTFEAFASCQPGLESLVQRELTDLGVQGRPSGGGVAFDADLRTLMRAGLWLGCASHVLLRVAEFPCRALGELQRKAAALPWRDWLHPNVPIELRATTKASRVYHTNAAAERVTNAIVQSLKTAPPVSPEEDGDVARIAVRFRNDVCTISIDTTATPLHRRGYRLATAKAPLREDLAHALLVAAALKPDDAVLDPFCGSGTIAIEAAGIAAGLAPGRLRAPPLQHLALFDQEIWTRVRDEMPPPRPHAPIAASDRDAGAAESAHQNAERAGVAAAIEFTCGAFTTHPWLQAGAAPERGLVATNPPFGKRVSGGRDLLHLYQRLGHCIAELPATWRSAILAHDIRLARRTGRKLSAAFTTRHGGLPVTALLGNPAVQ